MLHRLALYGLPLPRKETHRSLSGRGWHVTVTWPKPLNDPERIALAAVLGSDLIRELLSLIRHFAGSRYPQLFFERKREK